MEIIARPSAFSYNLKISSVLVFGDISDRRELRSAFPLSCLLGFDSTRVACSLDEIDELIVTHKHARQTNNDELTAYDSRVAYVMKISCQKRCSSQIVAIFYCFCFGPLKQLTTIQCKFVIDL
jgi:hypothetical protein